MSKEVHATLLLLRRGPLAVKWDSAALGQTDPPLNRGVAPQERAALDALAEYRPHRVLASDLKRARTTAERLAVKVGASFAVRRDLREQRFGSWQGRPWSEIVASEQKAAITFLNDFCRSTPPRGESLTAVARRVNKAILAEVRRHQRKVVCYVGHAGPIRCLIAHALGLPLEQVQRMQLDPFGLSVIRYQGDASVLALLNHPTGGDRPGGLPG
ncbi:MAG: hypothetical protein CMJ83_17755 [Planctomycetes bacterium]|nr:hypothetical protein [Planctomycetota bacterium]